MDVLVWQGAKRRHSRSYGTTLIDEKSHGLYPQF